MTVVAKTGRKMAEHATPMEDLRSFKREVILALFADNVLMQQLVLKGGNLLDIVYGISTRPSRDIDLSICGDVEDVDGFRARSKRRFATGLGQRVTWCLM
jgi:predicted nucleotidyltransferase component of viral defense system